MSRRRPQVENSSLLRPLLKIAARPTTGLGSLGPFNRTTGAHSRQHQPDLSTLLHALLDRPNSNLITSPQPIPSLGPIPVTSRISVDVVKDPEARRRLSVHHKIQKSGKQDVTAKILRRHASTRQHRQKERKIYKQSKERGGEMGDRSEIPGFSGASNRIFDLQQPPQVPRRPKPRDVEKSHNYEAYYSLPPPALPSQPKPMFMEPQPSTTNSSGFPFASGPIPTGPFRLSSIPENEAADTFEEWQQIALRRQKGRRRTTRPRLSSDYDIE
ncbi:hypothetical protein WR25_07870 [Diploscapter pachys]|uniref:Uncharacterized protein n=1 Tax=Diploscapter pachys TaxID=2018661 RepID=A0A2A2LGR5_9BILA|nr:hypothetical protein WR25_07870 [Diploscapter pachys]